MRDNSFDRTIERKHLAKWQHLIPEYKAGQSTVFETVGEFYHHHGTCSQTFRKYYNRYEQSGDEADLLPRRRGARESGRKRRYFCASPASASASVERQSLRRENSDQADISSSAALTSSRPRAMGRSTKIE